MQGQVIWITRFSGSGKTSLALNTPEEICRQRDPKGLYAQEILDSKSSVSIANIAELSKKPHIVIEYNTGLK